jgi:hypothetical protein
LGVDFSGVFVVFWVGGFVVGFGVDVDVFEV